MPGLELENVRKSFGVVDVINGVDQSIANGELVVFVGPSGCGMNFVKARVAASERGARGGYAEARDREPQFNDSGEPQSSLTKSGENQAPATSSGRVVRRSVSRR